MKKIILNLRSLKYFLFSQRKNSIDIIKSIDAQLIGKYELFGNNVVKDSSIGKYSYLAHNTIVSNTNIGNYCSIGPNVVIGYGDHPTHLLSTSPKYYCTVFSKDEVNSIMEVSNKMVTIENDVWIGANTYIKNGVRIGTGAIVGANSFVNKDVPPFGIVVGSPAKLIKYRFDEILISQIIKSKWWEIEPKKLNDYLKKYNLSMSITMKN